MNRQISKEALYILERFSDVQRGQVLTAWLEYSAFGVVPQIDDLAVDTALRAIILLESYIEQAPAPAAPHQAVSPNSVEQKQEPAPTDPLSKLRSLKAKALDLAPHVKDEAKRRRMEACSKELKTSKGGFVSGLERCNIRICPSCRDIKISQNKAKLQQILKDFRCGYMKVEYLFVTLTVKNVPLKQLNQTLDEINIAWSKMSQKAIFTNETYGFAKAVHIEKGKDGLAHPHLHVFVAMKSDYRKRMNSDNDNDFQALWAQAINKKYIPYVNMKHINTAVPEHLNYIADNGIVEDEEKPDPIWLAACDAILSNNRRFIAFGGAFKSIMRNIKEGKENNWHEEHDARVTHVWKDGDYVEIEKLE